MYNKKYILGYVCLIMLFLISIVSAVQTQISISQNTGIELEYLKLETIKQKTPFSFWVHAFNKTDGLPLTNETTNCYIDVYNIAGDHLLKEEMGFDPPADFEYIINSSSNSLSGRYAYIVWCNASTIGGFASGSYLITEGGIEMTESRSILTIGLLAILFLFVFASLFVLFSIENYMAKFISYWISHILFVLITFVSWQIGVEGLLGGVALTGIFKTLFWIFTITIFPMIYLSIAWIVYIHAYNEHFQKLIDKGEDPETAFAITKKKKGWIFGN